MTGQREKSRGTSGAALAERLADMAHELRSPLGGIDAMIELLASTKPNAEQERLISGLRAASAHMRSLAREVIVPGAEPRSEATQVGVVLQQFSVAGVARARARELLYMQEVASPCETALVGSGVVLRQMLENLVDNAFRHAEKGVVSLRVTPALAPDGAPVVRFDVLDEGPGLTTEQAQRIFARGVTLDDRSSGSGLGLAIVAKLAASHGGTCGASPRPDRPGAMVWFTLPVIGYCEAAKDEPATATHINAGRPILLVDDDATGRRLLRTVLDHLGFETRETESPRQALEWLETGSFAGVCTDISMAEMNGFEFIAAVRSLPGEAARLPVISVSGHTSADDHAALKAAGCDAWVDKPLTIHELRKALRATGLLSVHRCAA
ncbi:MAG: hybrid sensor histidine kinase/response regulator [Proteobacteria bacterium]|nr:hybrid sensor histidine kinase/response regulator [Pseudomonadota bacterium]